MMMFKGVGKSLTRPARRSRLQVITLAVALVAAGGGVASASTPDDRQPVEPVRSTFTAEFGVPRPTGLAFVSRNGTLVVSGSKGASTRLLTVTRAGDLSAATTIDQEIDPGRLIYDAKADEIVGYQGTTRVSIRRSQLDAARPSVRTTSAPVAGGGRLTTVDPISGSVIIVDGDAEIERVKDSGVTSLPIAPSSGTSFDALAVNGSDGLLYAIDASRQTLLAYDGAGRQSASYDLSSVELGSVTAMVFAPSADATDDPAIQHLYISDAGTAASLGRVVEVSLAPSTAAAAAAAPTVTGSLVRTVETSAWSPASPDPSGITYLPATDRLVVVDSEVEEVTGAGYHGVNMWTTTRAGVVTDTGTTHPRFSKEPTGLGSRNTTNPPALFISDDSKKGIHVDLPGADGRFGTADDVLSFINTTIYGSTDTEDPEFDPDSGHLFFLDGVNTEIYRLDPVDGVFGNGNDQMSHFDVGILGAKDFEGLGSDPVRGTLLVGARTTKKVYEITKTGSLVQTIDLTGIAGLKYISGLVQAPASDGSGRRNIYIVDRAVDNDQVPTENDGRMFEISIPTSDNPPTVQLTNPSEGATVSGSIPLTATASDDVGVASVRFAIDGVVVGTDSNPAGGWSVNWNSTSVSDGTHMVSATATDTIGQTAVSTRSFSVDNVDEPPTVAWSSPAAGAHVRGSTVLGATAADDVGVASVRFSVDGTTVGTDTNGNDGWSVTWASGSVSDGAHTLEAVATDTAGQTSAASRTVTVDNTAPTVAITAPSSGSTVSASVTVQASASDAVGVASVTFWADGQVIGTDSDPAGGWTAVWNTTSVSNGSHTLTASASDQAGNVGSAAGIPVTVGNAAGGTVDLPVATGDDDVEEKASNGNIVVTSTDLDMMLDRTVVHSAVGVRFSSVPVPRGATVTRAWIQFSADEVSTAEVTDLVLAVQDADNAPAFTTVKRNLTGRTVRSTKVPWTPPTWSVRDEVGPKQRTPDLAALVQGVASRPGWSSGNAMVFIITGSGPGTRVAGAFEDGAPPVLHIEWTAP